MDFFFLQGVTFSGVAIQEKNSSVGLIVVLKESTIRYHIPDDGLAIEPASNRNMTILVSPATFSCETSLSFSVSFCHNPSLMCKFIL